MRYVHPLRLYLVASLLFFFFLSMSAKIEMADSESTASFSYTPTDTVEGNRATQIITNDALSDQQVIDSLKKIGEKDVPEGWLERRLFSGGRKVEDEGPGWFLTSFIQNMPIALLLAMPILALMLKLTYFRQKMYYVSHLVHTLHLHSLALLLFSVLICVSVLVDFLTNTAPDGNIGVGDDWLELPFFLALLTYAFVSFLRVYRQRWWVTMIKLTALGLVYSVVLALTIGLIAIVALLDF